MTRVRGVAARAMAPIDSDALRYVWEVSATDVPERHRRAPAGSPDNKIAGALPERPRADPHNIRPDPLRSGGTAADP